MTWFLLSVLTALFATARDFQSKRFLSRVDPLTVSWALSLFSVPALGIALAFTEIPSVDFKFYFLVVAAGSALTVGWILYIRAMSVSEMSLSIPIIYLKHRSGFQETYTNRKILLPIGLSVAMMFLCQASAMRLGPVAYVVAIKRFSVLFSVAAGGVLLKEQQFRARLAGSTVMVCGIVCIAYA